MLPRVWCCACVGSSSNTLANVWCRGNSLEFTPGLRVWARHWATEPQLSASRKLFNVSMAKHKFSDVTMELILVRWGLTTLLWRDCLAWRLEKLQKRRGKTEDSLIERGWQNWPPLIDHTHIVATLLLLYSTTRRWVFFLEVCSLLCRHANVYLLLDGLCWHTAAKDLNYAIVFASISFVYHFVCNEHCDQEDHPWHHPLVL